MTYFKKTYNKVLDLSGHKHAVWYLGGISFIESSFFPIPADVLLITMVLAKRAAIWKYIFITTIFSVLGAIFGYFIGYGLYEHIGSGLINYYGYQDSLSAFKNYYNEFGNLVVLIGGLTPFPYKVVTISSGFFQLDLLDFIFFSVIARGLRFFIVAIIVSKFDIFIKNKKTNDIFFFSFLIASIFILAMAYYIELIGKHTPCNLCTLERIPYFIVAFIASYYFIATKSFKKAKALVFAIAAAFTSGFLLSVYHVGIEKNLWNPLTSCSNITGLDAENIEELRNSLNNYIAVSCEQPSFFIFGVSLAELNLIISLFFAIISLSAIIYYKKLFVR